MNPEQLKLILQNLNSQLINTLTKFDPNLKNHYSAQNPSFRGICFLIQQVSPFFSKTGENELNQLLDLTIKVRDYFKLQTKDKSFASCFVFINYVTVDNIYLGFENNEIKRYFSGSFQQTLRIWKYVNDSTFSYFMIDQNIDGFTLNTYFKFTAEKNYDGSINICEKQLPVRKEPQLLTEISTEVLDKCAELLSKDHEIDRKKIIDSFKKGYNQDFLFNECMKIKTEFEQFSRNIFNEYVNLLDTYDTLVNVLNNEIKTIKKNRPASFIHLPFDKKSNQEIIDYLYKELTKLRCFDTTLENFKKIFSDDNSFITIHWLWKANTLVHLFTGFNFDFDGIPVEFPGLMNSSPNRWITLADKFHIERKSDKTPLYKHLEKLKRRNQKPTELVHLLPIIDNLKKGWYKKRPF